MAQPVSEFCKDSAIYNQPDFVQMSAWFKEIDEQIWTSPFDALQHFYSEEITNYDWKKYPCLDILYNHKLADVLKTLGAYDEADKAGRYAYQLDSLKGSVASNIIISMLAAIAYQSKDYAKSAHYYDLNYQTIRKRSDYNDPVPVIGALNNHALALLQLDSISKAKELLLEALKIYDPVVLGPRTILASLFDNLADAHGCKW